MYGAEMAGSCEEKRLGDAGTVKRTADCKRAADDTPGQRVRFATRTGGTRQGPVILVLGDREQTGRGRVATEIIDVRGRFVSSLGAGLCGTGKDGEGVDDG